MNIKEASQITGLSSYTIRYYEEAGIIMPVPRKASGTRDFGERNVNQLQFAKIMREAGLSIEKLREYIGLISRDDDKTIPERKALLQAEADKLSEKIKKLQSTQAYLQHKIDNYEGHMRETEKKLSQKS